MRPKIPRLLCNGAQRLGVFAAGDPRGRLHGHVLPQLLPLGKQTTNKIQWQEKGAVCLHLFLCLLFVFVFVFVCLFVCLLACLLNYLNACVLLYASAFCFVVGLFDSLID